MATEPPAGGGTAATSSPGGNSPFGPFLSTIANLPTAARHPAFIAVLVVALVVWALQATETDPTEATIILVAFAAGICVLLTMRKKGLVYAVAVWAAGFSGAWLSRSPTLTDKPVPPTPSKGETHWFRGSVVWQQTGIPVADATVYIVDYSDSTSIGRTTDRGAFRVGAVLDSQQGDSVKLAVPMAGLRIVKTVPVTRGAGIEILLPSSPQPQPVARGAEDAGIAFAAEGLPRQPSREDTVRVVLDSIRVHNDGKSGWATWSFDVDVNDHETLRLPAARYSDDREWSLVPVRREIWARIDSANGIRLRVHGERRRLFGDYDARGSSPRQKIYTTSGVMRMQVRAQVRGDEDEGVFDFYFTVVPINSIAPQHPKVRGSGESAPRREAHTEFSPRTG